MTPIEETALPASLRTILVVEDNDINREMLCSLLEDDFEVMQAKDGREGIELLKRHYDILSLVLLDVYMPECDGFDFLRFRQTDDRYSNVPVIVTTVSDSLDDEIECLKLGSNDFVVKPYDVEIILNRIRNTIKLRETASIVNQLTWDSITNLYREEFFFHRVEELLETYPDRSFDIVCSDIKNFKTLNDRYGRERCNHLLHELANRLMAVIPGLAAGGRISGDSFAFLIDHQEEDWTGVLGPTIEDMTTVNFYVKFGIVEDVDHSLPASQLCDRAAMAMQHLRGSTGAGVAFYDEELRQQQITEQIIIESMSSALRERQFMIYYQPKHDVHNGSIAGAEALLRWNHPELGLIRPDLFIGIFERNGLITAMDRYVCEEVCREIRRCVDLGLPTVPISINLSRLDFDDHDLAAHVAHMADRYDIDRNLLHIELTETAYSEDPDAVVTALKELRSSGFHIELDDFGSGYSSLASLNMLPLDILKLDGSMIRQATKLGDFRIIESAIQIAQFLGLETVVEGVETAEELDRLRGMGCDLIQGIYYSWPLEQSEFEAYLARQGA